MEVISIIIPCYNEEDSIPLIYNELKKVSNNMKYDFEFIFVNDGSIDNSLSVLKKLSDCGAEKIINLRLILRKISAFYSP